MTDAHDLALVHVHRRVVVAVLITERARGGTHQAHLDSSAWIQLVAGALASGHRV